MREKENQRVALTKRLLKEGLLRLLEKKELAKIHVTELCMESGINRATFYKYYSCPEDVLAAIKEQFFHELLESQKQDSTKNPLTYIEAFGRMCSYLHEHKDLAKTIFRNMDFNITDMLETLYSGVNEMHESLEKNFDPESVKLAATYMGYGGYSIVCHWLLDDIDKTPEEIADIVHKLLDNDLFQ